MQDGELGAVLCALAGPRHGDRVAAVGAHPVALRALLAAAGTADTSSVDARVALTGSSAHEASEAADRLAPGGRLVGVAADLAAALRLVRSLGLVLRHVEQVGDGVAWAAVAAGRP